MCGPVRQLTGPSLPIIAQYTSLVASLAGLLSAIGPGAARATTGRRRVAMVDKSIVAIRGGDVVAWCKVEF